VSQVLRQRLLLAEERRPPRLLDYGGRGPLAKWLKVAALRTALSLRRGAHAQMESDDALAELASPGREPELELMRGRYGPQFRQAFAAAFQALSSQQRNLLRLHHLEDATLAQIGHHSGLHRTTVARHLEQARQVLFDETRRRIAEQLQLGREDFEALISLLRSQLDVSIRRFLQDTRG
jgi:RNA polymerase sigma-70 factor (ECF subfamily)